MADQDDVGLLLLFRGEYAVSVFIQELKNPLFGRVRLCVLEYLGFDAGDGLFLKMPDDLNLRMSCVAAMDEPTDEIHQENSRRPVSIDQITSLGACDAA